MLQVQVWVLDEGQVRVLGQVQVEGQVRVLGQVQVWVLGQINRDEVRTTL